MARSGESWREKLVPVSAILTLGLGLLALFLGYGWFWMIFVIGWVVVVPIFAILFDGDASEWESEEHIESKSALSNREDALETLRDRYARGEIDDATFERKVELLLENESIEQVEERVETEREKAGR